MTSLGYWKRGARTQMISWTGSRTWPPTRWRVQVAHVMTAYTVAGTSRSRHDRLHGGGYKSLTSRPPTRWRVQVAHVMTAYTVEGITLHVAPDMTAYTVEGTRRSGHDRLHGGGYTSLTSWPMFWRYRGIREKSSLCWTSESEHKL